MKKLSVLMAGLTAVSIGGVYAAWTYAEAGLTPIASKEQVITVAGIDTSSTSTKAGKFDMVLNNVSFTIDSAKALGLYTDENPNGYHQHEAVLDIQGTITVYFVPSPLASTDILTKGLPTKAYFTYPTSIVLKDILWDTDGDSVKEEILKFDSLERKLGNNEEQDGEWTKMENVVLSDGTVVKEAFAYTYTEAMLKSMFTLEKGIVLDDSAKHTEFDGMLDGLTVKLHVEQM